jgi:hypothetical protein
MDGVVFVANGEVWYDEEVFDTSYNVRNQIGKLVGHTIQDCGPA